MRTPSRGKKKTGGRRWRRGARAAWTLMIVEGVIKEHIQEDAHQKNIIPDMIRGNRKLLSECDTLDG